MTKSASMDQCTAVLVLGMHRSGTSAITRVLSLLGAELGGRLLSPQDDNKKGFWEHSDAVEIHDRLLASLGRTWHDMRELPNGWEHSPAALQAVDEICALIKREFDGKRLWSVKDPRMCRLTPLWLAALQRLGIRATALLMVRDPLEVADSLKARDGWSHGHSYLMWARHLSESIRATRNVPRSMLTYGDLLTDWRSHLSRIGHQLGLDWDAGIASEAAAIDEFISPDDRHHGLVPGSLRRQEIPVLLEEVFQSCSDVTTSGNWGAIEDWDAGFFRASELFESPLEEIIASLSDVSAARDEFARLSHERIERIHQLEHELRETVRHLEARYFDKVQHYAQLEGRMAVTTEQLARLESEHFSLVEGRAEARAVAEERQVRLEEVQIRLEEVQVRREEVQARLEEVQIRLEEVQVRREEVQVRLKDALDHVQASELLNRRLHDELEEMRTQIRSRRWLAKQMLRPRLH